MDVARVEAYLEAHRSDFEEQLKALIRIPSVSAQPDHNADTRRAAAFVRDDLASMGLKSELIETEGPPDRLRRMAGCARKADAAGVRALRRAARRAA